jgi:hypothetical protein
MTTEMRIATAGLLFAAALGSGIWLRRVGRPLNTLIFTLHKLIALAVVVLAVLTIVQLSGGQDLTTLGLVAMAAAGLFVLVSFATGAWLSIVKSAPAALSIVHKLMPALMAAATAAAIYLLSASA